MNELTQPFWLWCVAAVAGWQAAGVKPGVLVLGGWHAPDGLLRREVASTAGQDVVAGGRSTGTLTK